VSYAVTRNAPRTRPRLKDDETIEMVATSLLRRLAGDSWTQADKAAGGYRSDATVRKARQRWCKRLEDALG
jgi:hypothetical protein